MLVENLQIEPTPPLFGTPVSRRGDRVGILPRFSSSSSSSNNILYVCILKSYIH